MCYVLNPGTSWFRISDPDAVKPEDWDEDAPREIPDEDAVKPEGWLDEEPLEVDDPGGCLCCLAAASCVLRPPYEASHRSAEGVGLVCRRCRKMG